MKKLRSLIKNNIILYSVFGMARYIFCVVTTIHLILTDVIYSMVYFRSIRIPFVNDLTIGIKSLANKNVFFPHPVGIVIGKHVEIGQRCRIYQNVTIGAKDGIGVGYPCIGNYVTIYANVCIIGNVYIGDNVIIGAGSVVTRDIPSNSIAVGNPARVIDVTKPL